MASKLAKEETKGSQAEYRRSVAEMNARAGLSRNPSFTGPKKAKDVKPVGEKLTTVTIPGHKGNIPNKEFKIPPPPAKGKDETFRVFDSGEVVEVGDAQDHPDPAVQAKVDKYRATALKQGFKPERVEESIKQLLSEGRFKATSKVADAAFKPGDKVWANPIGKSGGTVKGTVARINASGQVVIESGGREREFHPSNVRASDVAPVGDESLELKKLREQYVKAVKNASPATKAHRLALYEQIQKLEAEEKSKAKDAGDSMAGLTKWTIWTDKGVVVVKASSSKEAVEAALRAKPGAKVDESKGINGVRKGQW